MKNPGPLSRPRFVLEREKEQGMIYIVEDDENIRRMESYALTSSGLAVQEYADGASFFEACKRRPPQLVILDVMLPGEDGFEILKRIRHGEAGGDPAVIMVTAKTSEIDKVMGLNDGADDYISKPFGIMEFVARVKAVLRRTGSMDLEKGEELTCGKIRLDENRHKVFAGTEPVELTYKEFELLKYLMRHEDQVMSRQQIMDAVWDTDFCGESRTVDMHVKTLRQKLGEHGSCIKTVRNIGYKLEHQE